MEISSTHTVDLSLQIHERWCAGAVTPKNRVQVPPEVHAFAPIAAIARALVIETDCESSHDYLDIVAAGRNSECGAELYRIRHLSSPISAKVVYALNLRIYYTLSEYFRLVAGDALDFAEKWVFGSELGATQIALMAAVDVIDLDVERVEEERARTFIWETFYGTQDKLRQLMRDLTKYGGWSNLDDKTLMDRSTLWVRAHHVHGSLTNAVKEKFEEDTTLYGGTVDRGKVKKWSDRLEPFDLAIGRPRSPGPWKHPP